jgi:hypothetical protein
MNSLLGFFVWLSQRLTAPGGTSKSCNLFNVGPEKFAPYQCAGINGLVIAKHSLRAFSKIFQGLTRLAIRVKTREVNAELVSILK